MKFCIAIGLGAIGSILGAYDGVTLGEFTMVYAGY